MSLPLSNVNVLLCITASVAAIRTPRLLAALHSLGATVKVVVTPHAHSFLQAEHPLPPHTTLLTDAHEWSSWNTLGDPVLHIQLRKWAHLLLIAPLSANTLAKLATGIADNLVTSIARAWRVPHAGPFLVAPAMNSEMWLHPLTKAHLQLLNHCQIRVIPPLDKVLACGDSGVGAMEEPENIAAIVASVVPTPARCPPHPQCHT